MTNYTRLFSPIKVGNTTIKNRVFMPPLSTNFADHGYVTDELIQHYAARAKGGVGLIVSEVVTVEPTYIYLPGDMSIYDDSFIEGWTKLFAEVHKYGTKLLPQLFHPAYMAFPVSGTPQLIAPSNVGPYYAKSAPRAVTKEELKVIIRQFGDAAYRVKQAGGDGVEIHAAHAHGLLGGFLTPLYNKRCDEYGGDINGRLRLTLEVIEEVRRRCGDDFIIDVRMSGDEYSDGGLNINDAAYIAKQLEKAGVDMLHVSGGTTIKRGSSIPAPGTKQGSHAELAAHIKKQVSIPVATVGRITEPWIADEMIANGMADACTINPSFELENEDTLTPAETRKNVLVIGGGAAGMEAAFVAKKRGHNVVLCEASSELGGQLHVACVPIGKQDLTKVVQFMTKRLKDTGVEIHLNTPVTKELLETTYKDYEVIAATGAKANTITAFTNFKQWMTADDILAGKQFPGRKIIIIGGGSVGCELADYLAPLLNDRFIRNRDITILEMEKEIMLSESGAGRSLLVQRIVEKSIKIECNAKVTSTTEDTITYEQNGQTHTIADADTLVFANGYHIESDMEDMLKEAGVTYHLVGDGHKVGNLKDAISEAYEITKAL